MTYNATPGHVTDSEVNYNVSSLYTILGDVRLMSPFAAITGTNIADESKNGNALTASASVATWFGHAGRTVYYDFGADKRLYRANDTDFDFGDGAGNDTAFSIACAINLDTAANQTIIGKWDETAASEAREWLLYTDASGYPTLDLYDESGDHYIGRQDQTAFATGSWKILITTYSASETSDGIKIFIDGVQLDDADHEDGGYASMDIVVSELNIGARKNAAAGYSNYLDGKLTWPIVTAKELNIHEVWAVTKRLKGLIGA